MRKNSVFILVVALLMGGGAAYLARSWLQAQMNVAAAYQPAGHIVIAAEPLAYGAVVTAEDVNEIPWYTNTLPEGAFATKDDLLGGGRRIVLSALNRGEPVLRSKVTGPGQRASLATQLEEGKRAVTVQVDDVRGVAGFVLPGDFVDIIMIADDVSSRRQKLF
jgi:pilus assembly protein CpaB